MINERTIQSIERGLEQSTINNQLSFETILANSKLFNIKQEIEHNILYNMNKKIIRQLRGDQFSTPDIGKLKKHR